MDITEVFKNKKKELYKLTNRLYEKQLINKETLEKSKKIINDDKISIAIVGQMKYGKSTFINALIFHSLFVPVSDIPMTAALTAIEYGEVESYKVEFFSIEEWNRIEKIGENIVNESTNAFREAIEKTKRQLKNEPELRVLFGTNKEIHQDEFQDYIGADGKYSPITKMLTIKYPLELLKEATIIDTPGFNDPIESREKRTFELLSQADIIILFLYAGRPFDDSDRNLIVNKLVNAGAGKVIVVVNKMDAILEDISVLEKVKEYITQKFKEVVKEKVESEFLKNVLLESSVIPLSSLMALLGRMDSNDIENDEDLKWYYDNLKEKFTFLKNQKDYEQYSGILELENEIKNILKKEKNKVLVNKVKSLLVGNIEEKIKGLFIEKLKLQEELKLLGTELSKIKNTRDKLINYRNNKFPKVIDNCSKCREDLENYCNSINNKIQHIVNERQANIFQYIENQKIGWFDHNDFGEKINYKMNQILIDMKEQIKKQIKNFNEEIVTNIFNTIEILFTEFKALDKISLDMNLSPNILDELKNNVLNNINNDWQKEIGAIPLISEVHTKKFLFFGDSTSEARKKARDSVKENFSNLVKEAININYVLLSIARRFLAKEGKIQNKFEEVVLIPIDDSLAKAQKNYSDKESRKKNIKKSLDKIRNYLDYLNQEKINLEKKLELS